MAAPLLIYCAGRGGRYADIAVATGFIYGCRSDYKPSHLVGFADLNWKRPDLDRHYAFVSEHRPQLAVAPDVLDLDALVPTLRYAERLAGVAGRVIIVPKTMGVMDRLPHEPWLVIGYSVPTRYGGTDLMMAELAGWPVHLLGGSPRHQLELSHYLDVFSADGNVSTVGARYGFGFDARSRRWRLSPDNGPDFPYRVFQRSCEQIVQAWRGGELLNHLASDPVTPGV